MAEARPFKRRLSVGPFTNIYFLEPGTTGEQNSLKLYLLKIPLVNGEKRMNKSLCSQKRTLRKCVMSYIENVVLSVDILFISN